MSQKVSKDYIPRKLLWIDLEMTGLDAGQDKIIELAVIVTDFNFKEIDSLEITIHQPETVLEQSNDWVKEHFEKNGLFDAVRSSNISSKEAEKQLVGLIDKHFSNDYRAVLAGNSIHQDRLFIFASWPEVAKRLHYRQLDVSSFKLMAQGKYGKFFEKRETHRALDDIRESIAELKYYLSFVK